jgi:hypothetical protein
MKSASLPAVRVEPQLRHEAESVLDDGETLSCFIEACVRSGVTWRRAQDEFLARSRDAVDRAVQDGRGISPEELLKRMDERLNQARLRLSGSFPHSR